MVATVTAVDTHLTPTARHTAGAIHTTVDMVGVTDGIIMDGVTMVDGVMLDTSLPAVTVDGVIVVDSVMKGMVVSPIQDMAEGAIAADPAGHRIVRRFLTPLV